MCAGDHSRSVIREEARDCKRVCVRLNQLVSFHNHVTNACGSLVSSYIINYM
jgi:hypothetical protein